MLRVLPVFFALCALPILLIFSALAALSLKNWMVRSDKIVEDWAKREGYRLAYCKARRIGSPWLLSSSAQRVYRIAIEGPDRKIMSAWVRCGSPFAGPLNEQIEVRWDLSAAVREE
jgi:hypothetical protein